MNEYEKTGTALALLSWDGLEMLTASVRKSLFGPPKATAALPRLDYPLPAAARIAVVGARLADEPAVRSFPHWSTHNLESWKPQALAGPRSELFAIGALRRQGYVALPGLCFPLVVLSSLEEGPLTYAHHERLWSLFELPVYEQIRGAGEVLVGWECDAREGWHLACDAHGKPLLTLAQLHASGWQGVHSHGSCSCGRTGLRLTVRTATEPARACASVHPARPGFACAS